MPPIDTTDARRATDSTSSSLTSRSRAAAWAELTELNLSGTARIQPERPILMIRVGGDRVTGRVMCFNRQEMDLPGGGGRQLFALWHVDEYVRTDAGWRIRHRSEEKSWVFHTPDSMKL